ncbi:MAG: Hsp70 family protein [Magnetococcales bacterium]|nr:Hsp70 family protein [Magnetococcales bacterium]MBF0148693.1 Hsp70 family protein [Magnetococcales bacterium]MBF0173328.1 Hsp70 family protein [Magnetococcales bacterium]MBF0631499.1 Hsp70 family protein [Magnetococcales bacterium]
MTHRFILGIDLGTSNSVIAVADPEIGSTVIAPVTQILGANKIGEKETLPSALYLPHNDEFPASAIQLPWQVETARSHIIGHFARDHGALVPDRLVVSAKSWLSHPQVDPKAPILPWESELSDIRISPFECSRLILKAISEGFVHAQSLQGTNRDLQEGQVVLTVPASFDEVARTLTAQAAREAGLGQVVLLEEPQAAFYAWMDQAGKEWREQVHPGDCILVADVGGGTADFSMIAVAEKGGELQLERISVGEHLLLGGDNMDLALAHVLMARLEEAGKRLDEWQFLALTHAASRAKVRLFEDDSLEDVSLAIPSRGASLFAKTITVKLDRDTLTQVIMEGFFPKVAVTDLPREDRTAGLKEFGLAYAADPVISKQLARFLTRSLANVRSNPALQAMVPADAMLETILAPTAVLFNGGVFKAQPLRQRVLELLSSWRGAPVRLLEGFQPDLAVARGAAIYGHYRQTGKGMRIKAGTARSYYVGLESSRPAVPGFKPPVKALCVVPQGMEEGSELIVEEKEFGLVTGGKVHFRFFSSAIRGGDLAGVILPNAERDLEETHSLELELPQLPDLSPGQMVPVRINAVVTELGILELWMRHTRSEQKWKIEFQVRTE